MRCKITETGISFLIPPAGKSCTHLKDTPDKGNSGEPAHTPASGQDGADTFLHKFREEGELLNYIYWAFDEKSYTSPAAFSEDVKNYIEDNRKNWKPEETAVKAGKVYIVYERFFPEKKNCLPMKG